MFDGVARGYDRTNAVLSVGNAGLWRAATGRAVDPQPGERILDIAAGTGTSAAALSKSGAKVIALDFSQGMVEEGRRRHPGLEFVQGDAEKLPFGDDEFDAVTISFGLRNVQRPQVALAEMYRVLKPGGRSRDLRVLAASRRGRARGLLRLPALRHASRRGCGEFEPRGLSLPLRLDQGLARPDPAEPVVARCGIHASRVP